jgi:GNAT superfamily N-acetyltransferase
MGGGAAELVRMVLVPEARGHRLGGRLLQAWRQHAHEQGFTSMQLRTNFLLQRAVRFYANEGLVLVSRQPRTLMRGDLLYFNMPLARRNADDQVE